MLATYASCYSTICIFPSITIEEIPQAAYVNVEYNDICYLARHVFKNKHRVFVYEQCRDMDSHNTIYRIMGNSDGFGYDIGPTPYDTQIPFAAHRRLLYPTVALDNPPFL
jgi:hypothetical protein